MFGSASLISTAARPWPLAKPVVANGRDIISCRPTRTTRLSTQAGKTAIVIHGRSHESQSVRPTLGSQWSRTENTSTSTAAKKKFGVDAPSKAAARKAWSKAPPLLIAPATPSTSGAANASSPPPASRRAVIGSRSANSSAMG